MEKMHSDSADESMQGGFNKKQEITVCIVMEST